MIKSDKSIHNICVASIKRSTIKSYDFKWTQFYESNSEFLYPGFQLNLMENELIICSTIIDCDNYSILTTKKIITKQDGKENIGNLKEAIIKDYGDFKGYKDKTFTFGQIQLLDGNNFKYFIETGKASMVMIHGVKTFIMTTQIINKQI